MRVWAFIVVLGITSVASAQSLTGVVVDPSARTPIEGVVVRASNGVIEHTTTTDSSGTYQLGQLTPGAYVVRASRTGVELFSRSDVLVQNGRTVRVDSPLPDGGMPSATVDVGSTSLGLTVTRDFVNLVPFLQPNAAGARTAENATLAAPQVLADRYGVSLSGAQSPEHRVTIDGVSANDPSVGITGTPVPLDFVQDLNVVTDTATAEFGHATGGAINVTTKSGTNTLRGSIWGNWTPGALSGNAKTFVDGASVFSTSQKLWNSGDVGLEVGGPLIKDRLWFFAGFSPSANRIKETRTARAFLLTDDGTDFQRDDFGRPARQVLPGETTDRFLDTRAYAYVGKLTVQLATNHHLSLSATGSVGTAVTPRAFEALKLSGERDTTFANTTSLAYSGSFFERHLLLDATLGWHHQDRSARPTDGSTIGSTTGAAAAPAVELRRDGSGYTLADVEALGSEAAASCDVAGFRTTRTAVVDNQARSLLKCPVTGGGTGYSVGGFGLMQDAALDRLSANVALTYFGQLLGHHTVKVGGDFEHLRADLLTGLSGGALLRESTNGNSVDDVARLGVLTGPDAFTTLRSVRSSATSIGVSAFAQDSWRVLDQITLNIGLRYEAQQLFTSDGQLGLAMNAMFSPRVGVLYDFTKTGRGKVFAHYARMYETVPLDTVERALNSTTSIGARYSTANCDVTRDAQACVSNRLDTGTPYDVNQAARALGRGTLAVDPSLRPQSSDEVVAGGEYELIPNGRIGVSYTRRWMNDVIEDLSVDDGATYFLGNPGSGWASTMPKATRDYDAITLAFNKAFSQGWVAQGSYTWSYLRGNYNGLFVPETGQLNPNTTADFELASQLANRTGPLRGDRTHVIKAFVAKSFTVNTSFSFSVGLSYVGQSGVPINYLGGNSLLGADQTFVLPRGIGGRTPFTHDVNAKLTATYKLTATNELTFSADVFNLFNLQEATAVNETLTTSDVLPLSTAAYTNRTPQEAACLSGNVANCQSAVTKPNAQRLGATELNVGYKQPVAYQKPISVRFGLRLTF